MPEVFQPRQALRSLLDGIAPPRPLFLPVVFSLGARVENVAWRTFVANPTKISSALRQIRAHLRADGVTCYFDPLLEAEALGGVLSWKSDSGPAEISWPMAVSQAPLPEGLHSPEEAARSGRVPVAVEVIRRLKSLLQDGPLLMAGVTGPLTLGAMLVQARDRAAPGPTDVPDAAISIAGAAVAAIAREFLEAGAEVILIHDRIFPPSAEMAAEWRSQLETLTNIVRFYDALPLLIEGCGASPSYPNCSVMGSAGERFEPGAGMPGIALPPARFEPEESAGREFEQDLRRAMREIRPAVATTAGDLPANADIRRLARFCEIVTEKS